jgi:hypothetical protein
MDGIKVSNSPSDVVCSFHKNIWLWSDLFVLLFYLFLPLSDDVVDITVKWEEGLTGCLSHHLVNAPYYLVGFSPT